MEPFNTAILVIATNHFAEGHLVAKAIRWLICIDGLVVDRAAVPARASRAVAAKFIVIVARKAKYVKSAPFFTRIMTPEPFFLELDF